jgi:hypothetical protein
MVVAVDLDGTLCEYRDGAPDDIGPLNDGMLRELKALEAAGWVIVIWTVRKDSEGIRRQLDALGVPYSYINENPHGPPNGSNKIYADVYLDDKAMTFNGDTKGLAERIIKFRPWHKAAPWED